MPSTELVLSNSRSNTYRRCQKQYSYKYVDKLKPREKALPLFRGDWLHQLLMVHYDGMDWHQRHKLLTATNWDTLFDEEKEELGGNVPEEAERLMKGYLAHYRQEDKLFRVVDTEIMETVELPNGQKVIVIIDMIVEDLQDHTLWIYDHKTVSRFYPEEFMLIDSQLALYFWAADKKLGYANLQGAVLNELITKPPTLPKFLEPSQRYEMRKNLHCDAYTYFMLLKRTGQPMQPYAAFLRFLQSRHREWWRRTTLPRDPAMVRQIIVEMMDTAFDIRKTLKRGRFTRTARKDCQYDCSFLELCMAQLQGADAEDIIELKYVTTEKPDEDEVSKLWPTLYKPGKRK